MICCCLQYGTLVVIVFCLQKLDCCWGLWGGLMATSKSPRSLWCVVMLLVVVLQQLGHGSKAALKLPGWDKTICFQQKIVNCWVLFEWDETMNIECHQWLTRDMVVQLNQHEFCATALCDVMPPTHPTNHQLCPAMWKINCECPCLNCWWFLDFHDDWHQIFWWTHEDNRVCFLKWWQKSVVELTKVTLCDCKWQWRIVDELSNATLSDNAHTSQTDEDDRKTFALFSSWCSVFFIHL